MTITIKKYDCELEWIERIEMPIVPKVGDIITRRNKKYRVKTRVFDIDNDNIILYVE